MLKEQLSDIKLVPARWKRITILVLSVVMLITAVYCLLRFGLGIDVLDRSGIKEENGVVRYLDYWGRNQTGWQYIDGKLCYFSPESGVRVSGWQDIDGHRYYFDSLGVRAIGWLNIDGNTYYLDDTGKMVTGWQTIDGKTSYFSETGVMLTGWQMRDGNRTYISEEGAALTGWQKLDGKLYYFTDEGYAVTGWQELDNTRFRFDETGAAVTGLYEDETGKYFFGEDSHPLSGWQEWEGKQYYCNPDGTPVTGWMTEGKDRYYFRPDGSMAVGEVKIDGVSNFFTSKGKYVLLCNPWYAVPEDYKLQLGTVEGFQFDSNGQYALQSMIDDCREAGYYCVINNTYRSKSTQKGIWDSRVQKYMAAGMTKEQAEAETAKSTAPPGHSEHQTGLAVDLNGGSEMYQWLAEHCWEYGFILRYPDDKIEITGIMYEPWHFRYVGTDLSTEIKELGCITLEEYIANLTGGEVPQVNTQQTTENQ